ncbi:MAG TPA: hypothetical protein VGJ84_01455 [Polyangiaceae bacterium]
MTAHSAHHEENWAKRAGSGENHGSTVEMSSSNAWQQNAAPRLVKADRKRTLVTEAEERGMLVVELPSPGPRDRGRLGTLIEETIEAALQRRGASAVGLGAACSMDAALNDQLYRARLIGMRGVTLLFPSLQPLASGGALGAEDSASLRWWLAAAPERPLHVVFDESDGQIGVYTAPRSLADLLHPSDEALHSVDQARHPMDQAVDSPQPVESPQASDDEAREVSDAEGGPAQNVAANAPGGEPDVAPDLEALAPSGEEPAQELAATSSKPELETEADHREVLSAEDLLLYEDARAAAVHPADIDERRPTQALRAGLSASWRANMRDLEAAKGPKPLAVVERMFVSSYVPLQQAVLDGVADERAAAALATWAQSFETSYRESFEAVCARGKRPTMVLDLPDIAHRIGRLHGARSVQLILVDAMRFDLGQRVQERLKRELSGYATLTEQVLAWAALPARTDRQIQLIGRGVQGLKETTAPESEIPVARGRSAAVLRRIRAGQRELLKLDLVEARLCESGEPAPSRLEAIAGQVSAALAHHLLQTPPRTLVLVFGDHGFLLDAQDGGTRPARHGGASPEEVFVLASAWLVGNVH